MTEDVWKAFAENEITHSGAHHLLAIHDLAAERGYARVTDVARFLDITTGSASTNLKSLKARGLVEEDDNKFLKLTTDGQKLASAILTKRNILKEFFTGILGVNASQAEVDACKTEHLISMETTSKMATFAERFSR